MTIKVGDKLPPAPPTLTETTPETRVEFSTHGKIVIVGVPGAYTRKYSSYRTTAV